MIKVLLVVLLAHNIRSDCLLNPYPRQLVSGMLNAQINNNPILHGTPQQYTYSLQQPLQQNGVSVVIAIIGLQINSHNQLDFSIEYLPGTQLNTLKFRVQVNDAQLGWRLLSFSFLASQSSLFQTSTQIVTQFSGSPDDGKYSVYRPILNFNSFQIEPVIKIFMHGLQIKAKPLNDEYTQMSKQYQTFKKFSTNGKLVTFFSQALQQKKAMNFRLFGAKFIGRLLSFSIQTNSQLSSLRFSYLIFSKKTISQKHSFLHNDFFIQNGNQFKFSSLQYTNMMITGLTGLKIPRDELYNFKLSSNSYFGQTYFQTITNYKYFTLDFTYIAFQMQQKFICEDCLNSPNIFENKFCVETCPRSYSRIQRLDNFYCQKCDIQQLKVVDTNTGDCVCAKRHYLDQIQNICKPCSYDCMTCTQSNQCLTCDNNLLQTKRKLNRNGRCQCPVIGYYDDKDSQDIVCQACDSKCLTCNGPRAHDCLTCSQGKQIDSLGFCFCKNGFVEDSNGNCTCNPPRIIYNNICLDTQTKCKQNQVQQYVQLIRRCICKQQFIQVGDNCIKCSNNSIFDQDQLSCKCTNKTININGQCVPCPQNQVFDDFSGICLCKPGTFKSKQGKCVTCPRKMTYINGSCQCIFNYFESRPGLCQRCLRQTDGPKCRKNSF